MTESQSNAKNSSAPFHRASAPWTKDFNDGSRNLSRPVKYNREIFCIERQTGMTQRENKSFLSPEIAFLYWIQINRVKAVTSWQVSERKIQEIILKLASKWIFYRLMPRKLEHNLKTFDFFLVKGDFRWKEQTPPFVNYWAANPCRGDVSHHFSGEGGECSSVKYFFNFSKF